MKRLNKEYEILVHDNFNIKYGTVNKNNPSVIYIILKTWVWANNYDNINSNDIGKELYSFIRTFTHSIVNEHNFTNQFICDLDFDITSTERKNFLSLELYLKQQTVIPISDIGDNINLFTQKVASSIYNKLKNENFNMTKNK